MYLVWFVVANELAPNLRLFGKHFNYGVLNTVKEISHGCSIVDQNQERNEQNRSHCDRDDVASCALEIATAVK